MIGIEAAERKALAEQAKQKGPLVSLHCLCRVASASASTSFCCAVFRFATMAKDIADCIIDRRWNQEVWKEINDSIRSYGERYVLDGYHLGRVLGWAFSLRVAESSYALPINFVSFIAVTIMPGYYIIVHDQYARSKPDALLQIHKQFTPQPDAPKRWFLWTSLVQALSSSSVSSLSPFLEPCPIPIRRNTPPAASPRAIHSRPLGTVDSP